MFPEQKQIMQTTCSSLIKFSSVTFWPIRRFKKQNLFRKLNPSPAIGRNSKGVDKGSLSAFTIRADFFGLNVGVYRYQ